MLSSASDKEKLFPKNFPMNSNLEESGIALLAFPCRINVKLHGIFLTSNMVQKAIMNLDSSKACGPECILVVVLKNSEPKLLSILGELLNICLQELCFPDYWKV